MDYSFFVRPLCTIDNNLVLKLLSWALSYDDYAPHNAFSESQTLLSHRCSTNRSSELDELLLVLDKFFPVESYSGADLNKLLPGDSILEHSDIGSTDPIVPFASAHRHKIHIPLVSEKVQAYHRRSLLTQKVFNDMSIGKAYVYNDYVHHGFDNLGTQTRIHLVLAYDDFDWSLKHKMYDDLHIFGSQRYEYLGKKKS